MSDKITYEELVYAIGPKNGDFSSQRSLCFSGEARIPAIEIPGLDFLKWQNARRPVALLQNEVDEYFVYKTTDKAEDVSNREIEVLKGLDLHARKDWRFEKKVQFPHLRNVNENGFLYPMLTGEPLSVLLDGASNPKCILEAFSRLGEAIAAVHLVGDELGGVDSYECCFPVPRREAFTISEFYEGVGMEFPLLLSAFFEVQKGIDSLRANWGNRDLVHYDLRVQNILYSSETGRISLIDWETAGLGNGLLDLGMVCFELIRASYCSYGKLPLDWLSLHKTMVEKYCLYRGADFSETFCGSIQYAAVSALVRCAEKLRIIGRLSRVDTLILEHVGRLIDAPEWFLEDEGVI